MKYEKSEMQEICQAQCIDQKYFWTLVKRSKSRNKIVTPIQLNRKTITDPKEIRSACKSYFEELYTPKNASHYDNDFKEDIEQAYNKMINRSYAIKPFIMDKAITNDEVLKCIKSMKNHKAPGWDSVTAEHLKYGGVELLQILLLLFNNIVQLEVIPKQLKKCVIIPIPKGEKDATILGNNRGITLLPVIGKLFEKVLFERHIKWANEVDPFDPLQGAAQGKCSSTHTSLLLRETISYNLERGSTTYVALLDTQKAFDTVWVKGLFYKMFKTGMDPVIWRLLINSYEDFQCHVQIGGELSESFLAGQGVHQGAPWSMHMFERHYNDMLIELKLNMGAQIHNVATGNPTFADDVAAVTLHKPLLQRQLHKIYRYSIKWRFDFNPSKSVILIFGEDTCPDVPLLLGTETIQVKKGDCHMGIYIGQDKGLENEFVRQRINRARKAFFASQNIGSRSTPVSPVVMTKLYWSSCVPIMTHGLEVLPLTDTAVEALEQAHSNMAKLIQGVPKQTANVTCLSTLGWRSIESHIDILKLLFLWRILLLSVGNIYKQVTLLRLCDHMYNNDGHHIGPLHNTVQVYKKYHLINILDMALKTGELMSIIRFKSLVKERVTQYEQNQFLITCMLYKSIPLFQSCIDHISIWPWWVFANRFPELMYKVRVLYRLLVSQSCLKSDTACYNKSKTTCNLCHQNVPESAHHLFFDCDRFDNTRQYAWQSVLQNSPAALRQEFNKMSSKDKTTFIGSGFMCNFVPEWDELYIASIHFCYALYRERRDTEE
jgi:hypothetical protein